MKVLIRSNGSECSEPVRGGPDCQVKIGRSSWDDNELSIKYAGQDSRGHVARYGEIPIWALPQMVELAIREGHLNLNP